MTSNARFTVRWLTPILLVGVLFGCASDTTTALPLSIQPTPADLVGVPNQPLGGSSDVVFRVNGGAPGATYFWNLSGTLPPGVRASPPDGATPSPTLTLSGTPSTVGVYSFTLAIDAVPNHEQLMVANFSVTIQGSSGGPLQILTKTVYWPSGISGYVQTLSASGGTPPYTWSATFPSNLTLSATGEISGDTTLSGPPVDVLVTLRDDAGQVLQETASLRPVTAADFEGTWSGVLTKGGFIVPTGIEDLVGQRLGLVFNNAGVITKGALHATALQRNQLGGRDILYTFNTPYLGQFNGLLPQLLWHVACKPMGDQELQLDCVMHYSDINYDALVTLSRVNANSDDTTAPTVTASNPVNGATNVTASQTTLTFSEPMSSGSATSLSAGGTVDSVTFSPDGTTATLSFGGLVDFRDYTLILNPVGQVGFLDLAGNPLAQQIITFRTGALSNNQLPFAQPQTVTAVHGQARTITLAGTDPDNNTPLTYAITAQPVNGTLSGVSGASVVYTSNTTYTGPDSFMFTVTDSLGGISQPAQVTLTVTNQAPTATPQSVSTVTTTPLDILLAGTDLNGDALTYTVTNQPDNGTLSGTAPNVIYTANGGYLGPDSLQFTVTDTAGAVSAAATVSIDVRNTNQPPTAGTQPAVNAVHDRPTGITLVASDPDGDLLTYTVSDPPSGNLSGIAPNLTYISNAGYVGNDSFTFSVRDPSNAVSNTATVNITVTNQAPVAGAQSVNAVHDRATVVTLVASDLDGDPLTYLYSDPPSGTVTGAGPNVTYTPTPGYLGSDSFTFSARDTANVLSNTATINITVTNQAPIATGQLVAVTTNTPENMTLSGSDLDGDSLTYAVGTGPGNGTLSAVSGASVIYTPNTGYSGSDSFTFTARDTANVTSAPATVTLTVSAGDAIPTAVSSGYPYTAPAFAHRIKRRDFTAVLSSYRYAIPLMGSDAGGSVTTELLQYAPFPAEDPTQPGQLSVRDGVHAMSMIEGQGYLFWNPTLFIYEYLLATYSSTVDPITGVITVSQPGAQAMVIYAPVTCHFWEDGDDTFTFRVRDSAGQTSSPGTITVWHKTGACSHPP